MLGNVARVATLQATYYRYISHSEAAHSLFRMELDEFFHVKKVPKTGRTSENP